MKKSKTKQIFYIVLVLIIVAFFASGVFLLATNTSEPEFNEIVRSEEFITEHPNYVEITKLANSYLFASTVEERQSLAQLIEELKDKTNRELQNEGIVVKRADLLLVKNGEIDSLVEKNLIGQSFVHPLIVSGELSSITSTADKYQLLNRKNFTDGQYINAFKVNSLDNGYSMYLVYYIEISE